MQVRANPPPTTAIVPVRAVVSALAATSYVTVPFPSPEPTPAIVSHVAVADAVHGTFAVTAIVCPAAPALAKLAFIGPIPSVEAATRKLSKLPTAPLVPRDTIATRTVWMPAARSTPVFRTVW